MGGGRIDVDIVRSGSAPSGSAALPTDRRAVVMRTLMLDAVAARAAALLADHGVPAILLKGRAIASWLYPDDTRTYGDVDLLVDPAQRKLAIEVLGGIGYSHTLAAASPCEYGPNETDLIGPTGVCIDLHHTLLGIAASPQRCWEVLSQRTAELVVGGRSLTVLDESARAMHLALHVAQNGLAGTKSLTDLERGLAQLSFPRWQEAAQVARALDAHEAFSAGLRLSEPGRAVAARLGLPVPRDVGILLRTRSAPAQALQIQKFVELRSLRGRLSLVGRKLWPTEAYMRWHDPAARAGRFALLIARLRRMATLPGKFGAALWGWLLARWAARCSSTSTP